VRRRPRAKRTSASWAGAAAGRQLLNAGAIDEISVHLVPVLFGSGTPMFGESVDEHVTLEFVGVSESSTPRTCATGSCVTADTRRV
jgi:dihydrofolate reductase